MNDADAAMARTRATDSATAGAPAAGSTTAGAATATHPRHNGAAVLVVDDQPANIRVVGQLLSEAGYDVVPALNGRDALELSRTSPPDLILLDMRMPGLDGFGTIAELKRCEDTRDIPVVFLTADSERENLVRAFSEGAVDYVTKPFVVEELLARVRNHVELKRARDRLARVAEERQRVAEIVSHDLRNHFGNILFAADMIDPGASDHSLLRLKQSIRASADAGMLFLQAFLDQNGRESTEGEGREALSVQALFESTVSLLSRQAEAKGMRLRIASDDPQAQVHCERAGALHVLQNMVSNAIKYAPPGSEIVLDTRAAGANLRLSVLDRGPGISAKDREKLFRRYVRLGSQPTGGESSTGLGLALAKQRARTMGGELWYDDREGGGAVFTLELPRA